MLLQISPQEFILINMRLLFFILNLIFVDLCFSQVGINTSNTSNKIALYLEAQNIATTTFGGFLMPVVTEIQQQNIPVSLVDSRDDGLMVYVSDPITGKQCWEIFDGVQHLWRSIHCLFNPCNAQIIYQENFESYINNTGVSGASNSIGNYPSGVTKWTLSSYESFGSSNLSLPGLLVDSNDYVQVINGEMQFRDTNGAFLFQTQPINISGYTNIAFSLDIRENGDLEYISSNHLNDFNCGSTENDYVDVSYSTNGGLTFTEVQNYLGNGNINHTLINNLPSTISINIFGINGSSLIIRVRIQNWADDEIYFLDNIIVTCL